MAFARQLMVFGSVPTDGNDPIGGGTVKLWAIVILTAVCLLHYFTVRLGLFLNRAFAVFKIFLLLIVAIIGIWAGTLEGSGVSDWTWHNQDTKFSGFSAFILVVYSYSGWENGNYISGEIKAHRTTLRNGAFIAVSIVTFLYTMVVVGIFMACQSGTITGPLNDLDMPLVFATKIWGPRFREGLDVLICLSAVGNMISVVYTSSKVKQAIASYRILPFSTFFAADGHFGSPGGALLLHWLCSFMVILAIPNNTDGYGFLLGLFEYGQLFVGAAMGFSFPLIKRTLKRRSPQTLPTFVQWRPMITSQKVRLILGPFLGVVNLSIVAAAAYPHISGTIPRFFWPVTMLSVFLCSFILFNIIVMSTKGWFSKLGWKADIIPPAQGTNLPQTDYQQFLLDAQNRGTTVVLNNHVSGLVAWFPGKIFMDFVDIVAPSPKIKAR